MKKYLVGFVIAAALVSCNNKKDSDGTNTEKAHEQVSVITDYNQLFDKFTQNNELLYVVNYWATWCTPCVEELPHFMEVNQEFSDHPHFEMILVSLDKADALETEVKPFVSQNHISTDVYILSDNKQMTEWIPLVNERWSGAIPATALYKNGKQVAFTEGTLTKEELKDLINKHL